MRIDAPAPGQIPALRQLWAEAFGDTEAFLDDFFRTGYAPERCRCVTVDGRVTAALYWFDCSIYERRAAYLYAIATARAYRGQGLCRRLMEDTHCHLAASGYAGTLLVPACGSLYGFYGRMGYFTCSSVREFSAAAAGEAVDIRPVEADEYARLRRELLPEGGVIQEGANLTFLQTQETLFAGDGFLLAAHGERNTLHAAELLGDESAAPGIARALGYARGVFRMPGTQRALAMYRPLSEGAPPAYFGLAFD